MAQVTTELDQNLIEAVKRHPQIYMNGCNIETQVWNDIAKEVGCKQTLCSSKWLNIHFNYAKIKNLIHDYWTLESVLQAHPETKIYLDGSLNFLDPYINKLPDKSLPKRIHQRYNWVEKYIKVKKIDNSEKNSTLVTQKMIQALLSERTDEKYFDTTDMTNLMEALENALTQCIITFNNNKESNINAKILTADMSEETECEDITEQLVTALNNYKENIRRDSLNLDNVVARDDDAHSDDNIVTDTIMTNLSDDIDVKEEILNSDINTIEISEIKSEDSNTSIAEQTDIKLFFNDLAESVSNRLSLEKQKELRQRVSLIVSELLENNESD